MRTSWLGGAPVPMHHDGAEQGRNAMATLIPLVALFAMRRPTGAFDEVLGVFQ
ncbi:hypothetical protein [Streptomyces sp. ID38640]|uniref:hypothetical protein n=1 Tax=Streptomyces sp. ID38640 TaxID=1265399 RepID=UPI002180C0B6|nr:hypothetical protein [Streptomyces sp. ID38640]